MILKTCDTELCGTFTLDQCKHNGCLWESQTSSCVPDQRTQRYASYSIDVKAAGKPTDIFGVQVWPYCVSSGELPYQDYDGLVGMAFNTAPQDIPYQHSLMNALADSQKFAVDKEKGEIRIGALFSSVPDDAVTTSRIDGGDPAHPELRVPAVRDATGHILVLDTGTGGTYNFADTPLCRAYALSDADKAARCLVGNGDIEFLQIHGDRITYKANTDKCRFDAFEQQLPGNLLPAIFNSADFKESGQDEIWTSTQFYTKVCQDDTCTSTTGEGNVFQYLVNIHVSNRNTAPVVKVCSQTDQTTLPRVCKQSACPLPGGALGACRTHAAAGGTFPPVTLDPTPASPGVLQVELPVTHRT